MGNCPKTTHYLLGYRHHWGQWTPSLYCEWLDTQLDRYLVHLSLDRGFSPFRPIISHYSAVSNWLGLTSPSYVLLASPVSSPCPDANGGIDLLAICSSNWLTLQLPWTNQTWKRESTKV